MAQETLLNSLVLPIRNADGSSFQNLALRKFSVESVVMSLGDKITGDVYYPNNSLQVTMKEYVEYEGVKYALVNPPTIVREGLAKDNSDAKGMTKYSFVFYHPMYMLGNFPFTDIAVTPDQERYLSESKTFSWIGTGYEFIDKLNKNLQNTQWVVVASTNPESAAKLAKMPSEVQVKKAGDSERQDVLSFDKAFISDALKTFYDNWEVPFIIDKLEQGQYTYTDGNNNVVDYYDEGKRFVILFGLPSNEIYETDENGDVVLDENDQPVPFVFKFGQGVGLKNNSRTPRNNKIITRIVGYGSEGNIPYGYPQILWTGDQTWDYTIDNNPNAPNSLPIYKGIYGGAYVKLIKHPFTRKTLMPSVFVDALNKKVNPLATGYDPTIELVDYYDAPDNYPNPVNLLAPSVEVHQFENIKPRLNNKAIVSVSPYDSGLKVAPIVSVWNPPNRDFGDIIDELVASTTSEPEKAALRTAKELIFSQITSGTTGNNGGSYTYSIQIDVSAWQSKGIKYIKYTSGNINFAYNVYMRTGTYPAAQWDDSIDEDGNYKQSYFVIELPQLNFDLYACASITEEMKINMRSGDCLGCTFGVQVDWDDYKSVFYDEEGNFVPNGTKRQAAIDRYPYSNQGQISVIVQKDIETFGTIMPNTYQQPKAGDEFVFLGISLPISYVTDAQEELDDAMKEYMLENNVYYFDYPLKFDEFFLTTNVHILEQMRNNTIVRFQYAGLENALYIKQMTTKYGENVLPQYDITLTDDVEIVLNQIGQVTDDVSRIRVQLNELQKYYGENIITELNNKLSRVADDIALGRITFQQGLEALGSVVLNSEIRSSEYTSSLYTGRGWRIDQLGNAELESLRVRSYLEVVELLINRMQTQEGDTMFSDNDQIDRVDVTTSGGTTYYTLSFKEKWDGYITSQMYGNILKGRINTLAAKDAGVSDVTDSQAVEEDGANTYYTSWMHVVGTHATDESLGVNQVRVVLYSDNEVPAGKNFVPCELMNVARWGCIDYSTSESPASLKESIKRRQQVFYISTTEGRIVKLTGVDAPILRNGNYGTTIGELPDFVKRYPSVAQRLVYGGDYLYAQGIVVGDFIKIDKEGLPIPTVVFCGDWIDGGAQRDPIDIQVWNGSAYETVTLTYPIPQEEYNKPDSYYIGYGIYFYNRYNARTQQYETHEVRNKSGRWQCLQSQPVTVSGVTTFNEPKWKSPYWQLVDGNENLSIEFVSSRGYSFRRGAVDTEITSHLFYGNVDITDEVPANYWNWTRSSESGKTADDEAWDAQPEHEGHKNLHLTNADMPATWSIQNKAIFTLTITLVDGDTVETVENQIIS